jgi:hypothetical protein
MLPAIENVHVSDSPVLVQHGTQVDRPQLWVHFMDLLRVSHLNGFPVAVGQGHFLFSELGPGLTTNLRTREAQLVFCFSLRVSWSWTLH